MSDDLEQPALPDSAAADAASPETTSEAQAETLFDEDGQPLEAAPDDDEVEEEVEGVKLRGKKDALEKWKAERLMQADYTRKTQDVAAQRQQVEADRQRFQQAAAAHQQYLDEVADVRAVDKRLAQFAQVNLAQLVDTDPQQALRLQAELQQLQAYRGQLVNSLAQKQQAAQMQQQRESAKQLYEARQVLERDIKGWSPELANKLAEFARTEGYGPEVVANVTNAAFVKTLHKAYQYDQLVKQRASKPQAAPAPVSRVSGANAVTTKPLSETSDAEFVRRRREYIAKHR